MNLKCVRCEVAFEHPTFIGYCPECQGFFTGQREAVHDRQHPAPGVHAIGKFAKEWPETVYDPTRDRNVCGLCGSSDLETGYGFAGGYGCGAYTFCEECYVVLDFCEDSGE